MDVLWEIKGIVHSFIPTPIEKESLGEACSCAHVLNIIVGAVWLLFESGDYFVQHFQRCGD